ncbi:MAG TPA: exo-alpha-sialidase [Chloroflexia bacterium]|nr:exo-alpha-sialidase [Chloroflexia bacterium]
MSLDLARQYSGLFRRRGARRFFRFAHDVVQSGKVRELTSFVIWEMLHQLRWYPQSRYIRFTGSSPISLDRQAPGSPGFDAEVAANFEGRGLVARRCANNWKLLTTNDRNEICGCLYPDDHNLYRSADGGASVELVRWFPEKIKAVFISSRGTIFVCVMGSVYRSQDNGASFLRTLDFASPQSFFRFNNAMTESPGHTLVVGEYGNVWDGDAWRDLAYLYFSADDGQTWEKSNYLIQQGVNKHVHLVKYSRLLDRLLVADGDNYKKLWLSGPLDALDFSNPQFTPVNRLHVQVGGYTSAAESGEKILLGTAYRGGTNFIVTTADGAKYVKRIVPDPYRRSPIDDMVLRRSKHGTEVWANLPFSTANTKSLLMYTADEGETWHRAIEYDSTAHKVWLLNSSDGLPETLYFSVQDLRDNTRVVYQVSDKS